MKQSAMHAMRPVKRTAPSVKFLLALISGFGVVTAAFSSPVFQHRPNGSDLQRMRGDVQRVGQTMHKVMRREHEQKSIA